MNPIRLLSLLATAASLAACASGAKTAEFEPSPKPDPRVANNIAHIRIVGPPYIVMPSQD